MHIVMYINTIGDINKNSEVWKMQLQFLMIQSVRGARIPLENMLEGLITQEPQTCDSFFTTEITDHLFQQNTIRHENYRNRFACVQVERFNFNFIIALSGKTSVRTCCP